MSSGDKGLVETPTEVPSRKISVNREHNSNIAKPTLRPLLANDLSISTQAMAGPSAIAGTLDQQTHNVAVDGKLMPESQVKGEEDASKGLQLQILHCSMLSVQTGCKRERY